MNPARDLAGKVVLVTGAAGGLGAALCHAFAAQGARVAALDLDAAGLSTLAATLPAGTLALAGDITQPADCERAVRDTVAQLGGLDLLVNNAGIAHRSLFLHTRPEVLRRVMEVNFLGAMQLTHAALPHLLAARGAIVAVSSVAGYAPLLGRTGYSASKHALHGFYDSLRTEVEDAGVDITLVCPSFIATGIARAGLSGSGAPTQNARLTAGGESQPDDIARRIVAAVGQRQPLLLPDRTSRLAWWLSRLLPRAYARAMKRRTQAEFATPPAQEPRA